MPLINPATSLLLVIDFQTRLMPVIDGGAEAVQNAARLIEAARILEIPSLVTEQNPKGLGPSLPEVPVDPACLVVKHSFGACGEVGFLDRVPVGADVIVTGCETHVCVLQTVLELRAAGRAVFVVADAVGSRKASNRDAALARMARAGAEIVTTEMVVFEWLRSARHPQFRAVSALIR